MPPTIVLIRHAEALHNVNNTIPDPTLSDLGLEQCVALKNNLRERFGSLPPNEVAIVSSPMRRTLQTASLAFDWLLSKGVAIEASADWQENSSKPCDTGTPVAQLKADFPHVSFASVDPIWPDKTSDSARRYAHARASILARGFLRDGVVGSCFFNADYRIYNFTDDAVDEAGTLVVRQDDSTAAGGMGLSWTHSVELGSELPDEDPGGSQDCSKES